MLIPFFCACYFREYSIATSFFTIIIISVGFGETARRVISQPKLTMKSREPYFIVTMSWLLIVFIGSLPFLMSDMDYSIMDSWFESCASWTTTGATCINMTQMPKSLLLWKAIMNWLGGMGIIVLTTSIFPRLGIGGQKMASAEATGPKLEKLTSRYSETAKITYMLYAGFTLIELILLIPTGMSPYCILLNTLSTISTSGIVNLTGTAYGFVLTPYIKTVFSIFSLAGSFSFISYFMLFSGKWRDALRYREIHIYLSIIGIVSALTSISLYLHGVYSNFFGAFGNSITQIISFASTSGFTIDEIGNWPTLCKILLLIVMIIGGCGYSTSGSLKVIRVIIFFKLIMRGIYKRIHPRSLKPVMFDGKAVSSEIASKISVHILLYFAIVMFASILLSLDNMDMETTLSAVMAAFTNCGTAFGRMTTGNFSIFSDPLKFLLSLIMVTGRLEFYAILIMFSRTFWNSNKVSQW